MDQQVNQYPQNSAVNLNAPMTVGQYLIMFLIGIVPIVNIVMIFVWAFGSNVNTNKKNLCRAILIWALIILGLYIVLFIVFGAALLTMFGAGGGMSY